MTINTLMIKHHPSQQLLTQHIEGQLALSLSIAVAAHIELCPHCQQHERNITNQIAERTWRQNSASRSSDDLHTSACFSAMLSDIIENDTAPAAGSAPQPIHVECRGTHYTLPRAFTPYRRLQWHGLGKISRARLPLDEGDVRSSLLHIAEGGTIPTHTHKGYELTLLLSGEFEDEHGHYTAGDFILLDESHTGHSPKTTHGCLCYTVSNAPLHFTQGVSQLFNSIGKAIY